jgi:hypothetical protein
MMTANMTSGRLGWTSQDVPASCVDKEPEPETEGKGKHKKNDGKLGNESYYYPDLKPSKPITIKPNVRYVHPSAENEVDEIVACMRGVDEPIPIATAYPERYERVKKAMKAEAKAKAKGKKCKGGAAPKLGKSIMERMEDRYGLDES